MTQSNQRGRESREREQGRSPALAGGSVGRCPALRGDGSPGRHLSHSVFHRGLLRRVRHVPGLASPAAGGHFGGLRQIPRRVLRGAVWAGAALFLIVYALRMADPGDSVVTFAPQTGFLFRIVFER